MPPDRSSSSARPAVPFDRDPRRWHPTLQKTTTKKTTVCCASLLTLWLARPPIPIPRSKERWVVQTPPSLPGARFPALPDKESASRRSNGRPETLEPRLGAPPLPHSGVGQKGGPCQVLLLAHGSLHPSARGRLACALLSPAAKGSLLFWPSRYRQQAPPGLLTQGAADSPDLGTRPPPPLHPSCLSSSQTAPDTQPDRPNLSRHSPPSLHRHGVGGFPS